MELWIASSQAPRNDDVFYGACQVPFHACFEQLLIDIKTVPDSDYITDYILTPITFMKTIPNTDYARINFSDDIILGTDHE